MTRRLPPLDLHAHVDPNIDAYELEALGAVVFAVTRSHTETELALQRSDRAAVWGAGVHPGLVGAQKSFSASRFAELVERTPYVGEVGLDADSRVDKQLQMETLRAVLSITRQSPRIVSLHSYRASGPMLRTLREEPIVGAVLHWWLGNSAETKAAVDLGCYFSINHASARDDWRLALIPRDRFLTETDHPSGDRRARGGGRPGKVAEVERVLGKVHGLTQDQVRRHVWTNFAELVSLTETTAMLPDSVQRILKFVNTV